MPAKLHSSLIPGKVKSYFRIAAISSLMQVGAIKSHFLTTASVVSTFTPGVTVNPTVVILIYDRNDVPIPFPVTAQSTWLVKTKDDLLDEIHPDVNGKLPAYLSDGTYDPVG